MIQRIRRHFSDRSVIEDGVSHTIYEENSEVIIEAHRSEPNLSIQTDDGEISVESGTNTFNKSYLESVNATVTKFDNTLVSYGSVYEEFELYISLTSDQLSELTDLKLRGESDLLNPTSEPSISTVLKCGNMYTRFPSLVTRV